MGNFQKLDVWQLSKDLAIDIYKCINNAKSLKLDFRYKSQITASAISIPSNVAEGDESNSVKQSINYFYIAKGSCAELIT